MKSYKEFILKESLDPDEIFRSEILRSWDDIFIDYKNDLSFTYQNQGDKLVMYIATKVFSKDLIIKEVKDEVNHFISYVKTEGYDLLTARVLIKARWTKLYDNSPNRWGIRPKHTDIFQIQDFDLNQTFGSIELKFKI
jgi:hypothetical protein